MPLSQLTQDLGDIRKGAKSVEMALKKQSEKPIDKIKERLGDFWIRISKTIEALELRIKECETEYEKSAKFFCENPKDPSEKLAEKFLKLWVACKGSKKELERLKLQAKKEAEKKAKEAEKSSGGKKLSIASVSMPNPANVKAIPGCFLGILLEKKRFFVKMSKKCIYL